MLAEMSESPKSDSLAPWELSDEAGSSVRLADVTRTVTTLLADRLGVPTALLSRTDGVWRFESEAWPADVDGGRIEAPWRSQGGDVEGVPLIGSTDEPRWTGIAVGSGGDRLRGWMLLLPGAPEVWEGTPVVSQFVPDIGALLEDAAEREDGLGWRRTARRYHRFCRRLARTQTADELYALILRSLSAQVRAEVGALAV
jgi:hypothetical protein